MRSSAERMSSTVIQYRWKLEWFIGGRLDKRDLNLQGLSKPLQPPLGIWKLPSPSKSSHPHAPPWKTLPSAKSTDFESGIWTTSFWSYDDVGSSKREGNDKGTRKTFHWSTLKYKVVVHFKFQHLIRKMDIFIAWTIYLWDTQCLTIKVNI